MCFLLLIPTCISFLTERSNTSIIADVVQNFDGLDSEQSFDVTVCLRQCHSLDFDLVTVWLKQFNCRKMHFFTTYALFGFLSE